MNLHIISSGSSGNCLCMEHKGRYIFIDAGTPVSKVRAALSEKPAPWESSLFITHEHSDHISGLWPLINAYSPKIYASEKTADILVAKGLDEDGLFVLDADVNYDFGDFAVRPFRLMHDAAEPFGYRFDIDGKIISVATDFGAVSDYLFKALSGTEIALLESNYEEELLEKSRYSRRLKSRIISSRGHLSNKEAFRLVGEMSFTGLKKCFLAHVSENSNDYALLSKYAENCKECYGVETEVLRQRTCLSVSL